MATVAVVVPCHNYGAFLDEAVSSVEAQTRHPDEIVIVDDGSTDETAEVINSVRSRLPEVRVLSRAPARGPAQTFNDGVRATSAELIVLLSADDRLSPRYLELMERAFDDPSVAFAYAPAHLFGAETGVLDAPAFNTRELVRENFVNSSAMFRREIFDRTGGFRRDFDPLGLEDWEFWVHCIEKGGRGQAVQGCWLDYRRHPSGSRNTLPRARVLRAHLRVWRLHRQVMTGRDLVAWMARSVRRNIGRTTVKVVRAAARLGQA